MNDFNTHLSTLLDDVAAGIDPRPDFEGVRATPVPISTTGAGAGRRFPRFLGVAAVSVSLLGGGVAAFHMADGEPDAVATSSVTREPVVETRSEPDGPAKSDRPLVVAPQYDDLGTEWDGKPIIEPADLIERSAKLGKAELDGAVMLQKVLGVAEPGEKVTATSEFGSSKATTNDDGKWKMTLELTEVPGGAEVPIRVSFGRSEQVFELVAVRPADPTPDTTLPPKPEQPKPEPPKQEQPEPEPPKPPEQPAPIKFAVATGDPYNDATYLKRSFWGTAPAGSVVTVSSEWGSAEALAGSKGEWELRFVLTGVPDGKVVHVRVSANTGGAVYEYELVRDDPAAEPEPQPVAFTANLGAGYLDGSPMKQGLYGNGTPGSVVIASTEFGSADAVVNSKGKWEMLLKMYEVPDGTTVGVRVINKSSESVYEFGLVRPASEPQPIDFTAEAAFVECDSTPPFNEYWGTSTAGAKITISSDFGGKQVVSNGDGRWEARVEFPEAPLNETFMVTVTSSKGEAVYSFPLKRVNPG